MLHAARADNPPVVANPVPSQTALAGVPFSFPVPANTFADDGTPAAQLQVLGSVALTAGSGMGGQLGLTMLNASQGVAAVHGTSTLVGGGQATVTLWGVDGAGNRASTSFAVTIVDRPPVVSAPIADRTSAEVAAEVGTLFTFVIPVGTFHDALTPASRLNVTGTVDIVSGGGEAAAANLGLQFHTAMLSEGPRVHGTPSLAQPGTVRVTVRATDEAGQHINTTFLLRVRLPPPQVDTGKLAELEQSVTSGAVPVRVAHRLALPIPASVVNAVAPGANLHLTGQVDFVGAAGARRLASTFAHGLSFRSGTVGEAAVVGVPRYSGEYHVAIVATDSYGESIDLQFRMSATGAPAWPVAPVRAAALLTHSRSRILRSLRPSLPRGARLIAAWAHVR